MANTLIALFVARLQIPERLQTVVTAYLLALMLDGPKKTLSHAARIAELHRSQFSRLLANHVDIAVSSLHLLAREVARRAGIDRQPLVKGSTWSIAILIDATIHPRSSQHVRNAQRFNHGQGFVIGHQWTNIVGLSR